MRRVPGQCQLGGDVHVAAHQGDLPRGAVEQVALVRIGTLAQQRLRHPQQPVQAGQVQRAEPAQVARIQAHVLVEQPLHAGQHHVLGAGRAGLGARTQQQQQWRGAAGGGALRIGAVPLFSGFMYAAVGSYLARVWRIFDFRFTAYPSPALAGGVAVLIYVNFFAHHWLPDIRLALFAALILLFARTRIWFRVWREERWMPLLVGWLLVALFIWFAENIGTFANAWRYPSQKHEWAMVSPAKLGAWYLLMYISFILVAVVHKPQGKA